ncbi:cupin [Virgisporangium aliadipatigenens]|uniref:Cupin n=1 Tax=Virgisporangium aliadipatigenens TaxID=741659 RepID=A0A8J3YNT8_9ACTN|nr:cupin domain-containing protein [Virgisporangium aliadipatigenens]GIJ47837.1 cupin [Virgisporangium aliadipatigenens]
MTTHRRQSAPFVWEGVPTLAYKESDGTFRDVTRQVLSDAEHGQGTSLRYFEVGPGGHTTLERHEHTHVVIPIRGSGSALVVDRVVPLALFDVVFVPSWGWHQFRAAASEPLGFLCAVTVVRDRPLLPTAAELAALRADPAVAAFIRV